MSVDRTFRWPFEPLFDRAAIALGLHPWAVWDDWFDAVPLSALDQAADRADAAAARTTRQEAA